MTIELVLMATKSNKAIKISQKHLLGIQDLSMFNDINYILDEAQKFIKLNQSKNKKIKYFKWKNTNKSYFLNLPLELKVLLN